MSSMLGDPDAPLLEQMGGVRGLVTSTLPVLFFVPVNAFWGLRPAMWAAIGAAILLLVWTVVRREKLGPAIGGFFAVLLCVFIAWRSGSARGYYLYGIITQVVYGLVFLVSAAVRWPLAGVIWGYVEGHGNVWRKIPRALRWYLVATGIWAVVFLGRVAVQAPLYYTDHEDALGIARIAMGWPLAIVAGAATVWAIKKATEEEAAWFVLHPGDRPERGSHAANEDGKANGEGGEGEDGEGIDSSTEIPQ
ncbi:DUF3159 domain-containing protein [Dietzia sp.]|uniref:DUF3159 domain-containing protein n=1 Tax=Dietzia sp. TaxID=1871616 RepID=UPI002FD8A71B